MRLRPRRMLIRFTSAVLRGLYRLFGGLDVSGLENIPKEGAALLVSNHLSWADPPALRAIIRRSCWFMANDFLFRIPVLGRLLPIYGAFPVRRGSLDRQALKEAEKHLKDGDLVVIFPEGGTSLTGRLVPFEGGPALLALRNNVPVIPIGITGSDKVLPMNAPYPRYARGGVRIKFGPPVDPEGVEPSLPQRDRIEALTEILHCAVAQLLPAEYLPEGEASYSSPITRTSVSSHTPNRS